MKTKTAIPMMLIAFALSIFLSCSQNSATGSEQNLSRKLQKALDDTFELYDEVGAAAAVLIPGQDIWVGTCGVSYDTISIEPDMIFQIASVTKPFVATVIFQLAEEGLLSLDDSLHNWLPTYPNIDSTITIRQLLNHTSGIYSYTSDPSFYDHLWEDLDRVWAPEEVITVMVGEPWFEPGTGYGYSNTNYMLLGMIIEAATSSKAFTQFRNRIFDPLGLDHTFLPVGEEIVGEMAHGWHRINGDGELVDLSIYSRKAYDSMAWTAGAIYSTAEDVVRFSSALFGGDLLSQTSLNQMLDFRPVPYYPEVSYGLGINTVPDCVDGVLSIGFDGGGEDYNARMVYMPEYEVHLSVLLNSVQYDCKAAISGALGQVVLDYLD